jgi:hypothetical protein
MTIEFLGMIHHCRGSEIHPSANLLLDRGYIHVGQAVEALSAGSVDDRATRDKQTVIDLY